MQRVSGRGASWHIPNRWLCCSIAHRWPRRFPSEVREQMLTRLPRPPPVSLFLALGVLAGLVSGRRIEDFWRQIVDLGLPQQGKRSFR
jgi:hypothetical protein